MIQESWEGEGIVQNELQKSQRTKTIDAKNKQNKSNNYNFKKEEAKIQC